MSNLIIKVTYFPKSDWPGGEEGISVNHLVLDRQHPWFLKKALISLRNRIDKRFEGVDLNARKERREVWKAYMEAS